MLSGQIAATIALFLLIYGFGYTITRLFKVPLSTHAGIELLETCAIGLATFSFIGVALKLLHIPLHIWVYLPLALAYPLFDLIRTFGQREEKAKKATLRSLLSEESISLLLLLVALVLFFLLFHRGAFIYPYLEDDDPWNHIQSVVYIGTEHTYDVDPQVSALSTGYAFYLEPYPPTYSIIMGVLWQVHPVATWILKFFNVMIATLALAFFYLFAREFLGTPRKALFATLVLAALPSFMSHFIWSQTLALAIFPIGMYAFVRALKDARWIAPSIIATASMLVTQPVVSAVYGICLLFIAFFVFVHERANKKSFKNSMTWRALIAGAAGVAVSFVFWGAQIAKWGLDATINKHASVTTTGAGWMDEYALQHYSFSDVFFPPHSSRIDQAIGWGPIVTVLLIIGLLMILAAYRKTLAPKADWKHAYLLFWLAFLSYIVFAPTFGLPSFGSSRFWAYLAIPLALAVASGTFILISSVSKQEMHRILIAIALLIALVATSLPAKIAVQTAQWPPGAHWTAPQIEVPAYLQMQATIPARSRVFAFCGGDLRAIGFDMLSEPWDLEVALFRTRMINDTPEAIMAFLDRKGYEYVTLDATCVRDYGENATTDLAQRLTQAQRFEQVLATPGFLLARVIR